MIKKAAAAMSALVMSCTAFGTISASADTPAMRDMTTQEIVNDMGVGINLGNTFEACGVETGIGEWDWKCPFETGWGSPKITKEMIEGYAAEGFGSLRVPVAWSNTFSKGDTTYTIDPDKMARVKEVVQWAVDADMYVIVNIHWDGGWWENFGDDKEENMRRYTRMWEQISEGFAEFDDHVIFESLNEEGGCWDSKLSKDDSYALLNEVNQTFVDLVRESGGNNAKRHLLIAGYRTDIDATCDERYVVPTDPENRLAVSTHYYTPVPFALVSDPISWCPNPRTTWGTVQDYMELNSYMDKLKKRFINNGIPIIMGECGMGAEMIKKDPGEPEELIAAEVEAMRSRGICPVLWDINFTEPDKQLNIVYNRNQCKISTPELKEALFGKEISVKDDGEINAPESITLTYKDDPTNLGVEVIKGGAASYISSDENIVTVDADGKVTPVNAGTAKITVMTEATDDYLPAVAEITVTVEKIENPPTMPESTIYVDASTVNTKQIELPEGWSWLQTYTLTEDETVCTATYFDKNYVNRTVKITVIKGEAPADSSSQTDTSGNDSSSSSDSSSSGSSSASSSSSKASTTSTTTSKTTTTTTTTTDNSPATGAGAAGAGIVAVIAAAFVVNRKRK